MNKETITLVGKLLSSENEENVDLALSLCEDLPISFYQAKQIVVCFPDDYYSMSYSIINKYFAIEEIIYNKAIHDKDGNAVVERYNALKKAHAYGEQFLKEKSNNRLNMNAFYKKTNLKDENII